MRLIYRRNDSNSFSPNGKQCHLHLYDCTHTYIWLHNIQNLVTTAFVKYNDTKFKWSILTYPHNFRVLLFQYSLDSRFYICNSGQTSTRGLFIEKNLGESFCWFINKVATGFNLLPSSWQMEQNSWPITFDVNRNYYYPWHRSFVDFFLFLDEINLYSCHLPIRCFFILSLLTDANRLKSSICKHNIAFSTSSLHVLMLQKSPPSF